MLCLKSKTMTIKKLFWIQLFVFQLFLIWSFSLAAGCTQLKTINNIAQNCFNILRCTETFFVSEFNVSRLFNKYFWKGNNRVWDHSSFETFPIFEFILTLLTGVVRPSYLLRPSSLTSWSKLSFLTTLSGYCIVRQSFRLSDTVSR